MNKLMDWMKGKFMKYHISDKEYDMIQADMQEENRNSLLFFSRPPKILCNRRSSTV